MQLLGDVHGIAHGGLAAEQEELIAAKAAQHVGLAHALHQQARYLAQNVVAGAVAVTFVDRFEEIEIDEDDAANLALTHRALDLVFHEHLEIALVVETGERVGDGEQLEIGVLALEFVGLRRELLVGALQLHIGVFHARLKFFMRLVQARVQGVELRGDLAKFIPGRKRDVGRHALACLRLLAHGARHDVKRPDDDVGQRRELDREHAEDDQ